MPRVRVKVRCPYCRTSYSGPEDELHQEGCPRPLERHLESLQRQLTVNTCPHCAAHVHVNGDDLHECLSCHTQWVAAWTQGAEAVQQATVTFRIHGEPTLVTELPEKGSGVFPMRDAIAKQSAEVTRMKTAFVAK